MGHKPRYAYYYKNDEAVDDIIQHFPFCVDKPIKVFKKKEEAKYEFEHYDLNCFKTSGHYCKFKGYRWWNILIEDELYDMLFDKQGIPISDYVSDILEPSMSIFDLVGGKITRIRKYKELDNKTNL